MPELEYVAIDVETTGLQPHLDRLIEVGAVIFDRRGVQARFSSLVNPHRSLPSTIRRLTGLTDADLRRAPEQADVLPQLADFIGDRPVVGHGAAFDLRFLSGLGLDQLPDHQDAHDTLELARIVLPEAPAHGLGSLATDLSLAHPRAHRAGDDALATAHLFGALAGIVRASSDSLRAEFQRLLAGRGDPLEHFFLEAADAFPPRADLPHQDRFQPGVFHSPGRPNPGDCRLEPAEIREMLDFGGPASQASGFEPRPAQIELATAIAQVFTRGGRLVAEAGTGTGKSMAYLVPGLIFAIAGGEPVVTATSTINLQEQLFRGDLPRLAEWFPWPFTAAMVKGRSNYLCGRRWERYLGEVRGRPASAEETRFRLKLLIWLSRTLTGDKSELRLQGYENWLWERVASRSPECRGSNCDEATCHLVRARRAAAGADLVVANHDLLVADALSDGAALPPHRHLIVDEAHHLEEAATRGLTDSVEEAAFRTVLQSLLGDLPEELTLFAGREQPEAESLRGEAGAVLNAAETFFTTLVRVGEQLVDRSSRRTEQVRLTDEIRRRPLWGRVTEAARTLAAAGQALRLTLAEITSAIDPAGVPDQDRASDALRRAESVVRGLNRMLRLVDETVADPRSERVYWLAIVTRNERSSLHAAPVAVGQALADAIYEGKETLVLTSATLAIADSFDFYLSRVGLGRSNLEELLLASPFDYLRQALVCVPSDFVSHADPEYGDRLAHFLERLLLRTGGRTLVLFTSHEQLQDTYYALRALGTLDGVSILAQGIDGNRTQVTQRFVAAPRAVLLGTSSFWEGVDLPGDSLQCVVIQKLPFAVPTEPIFAARSEALADPFRSLALPQAALRLKQGFGRLIRTSSDRGAVVLLDQRIREKAYGRAFLEVLPRAAEFVGPSSDIPEAIAAWLAREGHHSPIDPDLDLP